jgi:tetratricopeptide (TPR) repeat protein
MTTGKTVLLDGRIPITLAVALLLLPIPVSAQLSDSDPDIATSADGQEVIEVEQGTLTDQVKLFFHIEDTTRELNMEESGINSLNDVAGQSVGGKQLLALKEKYQKQLGKNPDNGRVWASLGSVLETLGEEDQALDAYEKAMKINPDNEAAGQGIRRIRRSRRLLTRVYYSFQHQKEYAPSIDHEIATWEEQVVNVQASKSWGRGKTLGLGWLESTIYQKNEIYGDVDFSLKRQAPFIYFSWPIFANTSMASRIRDEKFTNDDNSGYYRVDGSEHIITGYLALSYRGSDYWADLNYSREREPDPVYDLDSGRSALNIEVKQLTGISAGYAFAPAWELGASMYYEQYGSIREDQINPNVQLSHWLPWIPGTRVSLGYGYYSQEHENIVNLTTSYQWQPFQDLQFRFEYQLEYSGNEDSLLNQGDVVLSWSIVDRLSMVIRADYSKETGGDQDSNFYAQASLNWSF